MTVRYARRALSQLASVYDYLQQRNQRAAENVITSIRATIGRLRDMPCLGRRPTRRMFTWSLSRTICIASSIACRAKKCSRSGYCTGGLG